MDLGLAGKRAVVTGASRGIGLTVCLSDVQVDLASVVGPSQLIQTALDKGPIDILINNAGAVTPRTGGSGSVTDDQWANSLNLTLMAAVRTARAALPGMIEAAADYEQSAVRDTATGRFTTPQEVADLIVSLVSDRSANVTGADYIIDGGLTQSL